MNHHFACGKFILFQSQCDRMHHVTLSFSRKSYASLGFGFGFLSLFVPLNLIFDCFIIAESVAAPRFFYYENQFICEIECRGLRYECKRQRKKKLHRMTIFMKYATVAGNMTRRGKTSTHKHTQLIYEMQKTANYNSTNDTIGMLFVLNMRLCKVNFCKNCTTFLNIRSNRMAAGGGGKNGKKSIVVCKNENLYVIHLVVLLLAFIPHT